MVGADSKKRVLNHPDLKMHKHLWDRQVASDLPNDRLGVGYQADFSSRVMLSQTQWASALA